MGVHLVRGRDRGSLVPICWGPDQSSRANNLKRGAEVAREYDFRSRERTTSWPAGRNINAMCGFIKSRGGSLIRQERISKRSAACELYVTI